MKLNTFQGLMLAVVLMLLTIGFAAILVLLSIGSPSKDERMAAAAERKKRLNPISILPSALSLPPASNTPAILMLSPDNIDVEVDEMGVHILTTPVLKVWKNEKTGKIEANNLGQL